MIGHFGVCFYSAYLVAKKVIVTTKHIDDKQWFKKHIPNFAFIKLVQKLHTKPTLSLERIF
jgi:HSP90 family molecular chaperone